MERKVMQNFDFEGQQTRIVMMDGEPWWVATDVCAVLDLTNTPDAISVLDDDEKMTIGNSDSHSGQRGGAQMLNIISESGLYTLIIRSNKPEAKKFRRWVTHEVLPSIRKHGVYMTPQKINEIAKNPDALMTLVYALKKEQDAIKVAQAKIIALEEHIEKAKQNVARGEIVQDAFDNQKTILIGRFKKIKNLLNEGLILVWTEDGRTRGATGLTGASTSISVDSDGCISIDYDTANDNYRDENEATGAVAVS